jgi:hypothetical protein
MRNSELIRKLLESGLTYRQISAIAKCSHGSVHQEKLAMKKEEVQREKPRVYEKIKFDEGETKVVFPVLKLIE